MGRSKRGCLVRCRRRFWSSHPAITSAAAMLIGVLMMPSAIACDAHTPPRPSVEAVIATLSGCYLDRSLQQDREYIAPIIQTAEGFVGIVTAGERGHDRFRLRITMSPGERLVALWHTHGNAGYAREWFSAADTRLANRLGLASYLTAPDGVTRVYLPGEPTPVVRDAFRRVMPLGVAVGRVVRFERAGGVTGADHLAVRDLEIAPTVEIAVNGS